MSAAAESSEAGTEGKEVLKLKEKVFFYFFYCITNVLVPCFLF